MAGAVSARGLFKATGKKAKQVAVRDLNGDIVKVERLEREKDEFYPTPPDPVRAILHAERAALSRYGQIWEPAAGNGAMVREMERAGHKCFASDLIDRGCGAEIRNFYHYDKAPTPCIVTNPPFAECNWRDGGARFLYHALDTLDIEYMALLLSWSWPGAAGLSEFWSRFPPARTYLMRWKIDFTGQGAPPMLNGWFVWDQQHQGETIFRTLDRKDANQLELFEDYNDRGK